MVDRGEYVQITRPGHSPLQLTTALGHSTLGLRDARGHRIFGTGRGELRVPNETEWAAMDRELEREMTEAPFTVLGEI